MQKEQDYAQVTFDVIADKYDEIDFFKTSAQYVVDIIQKHTNMTNLKVLDVACGTGNVVLECAKCMPKGSFDAIDISKGMLAKAKQNAEERNITNINFKLQDVTDLAEDKKYNVITCSYAMFFLPEPTKVLAKLVSLLRARSIVIFTSFTTDAFTPSSNILLPLLRKYGSATALEYDENRWENLKEKRDLDRLCQLSYVTDMKMETKEIRYGLSVDAWWELVNNTGFKGMLLELNSQDYESVKSEYYKDMLSHADMDGEVELIADSHFVVVS